MVENTWTWPRYKRMQKHWLEWGPPPYIPIAGYFGVSSKAKRGGGKRSSRGSLPDKPEAPQERGLEQGERGNLNDLLRIFPGGRIQ